MSEEKLTTPVQETDAGSGTDPNWPRDLDTRLRRLEKVTMEVAIELGRTRLPVEQVLSLAEGSIVELEKLSGQPTEILANGVLFGKGEIVVVGDNLAIRVTDMIKPEDT